MSEVCKLSSTEFWVKQFSIICVVMVFFGRERKEAALEPMNWNELGTTEKPIQNKTKQNKSTLRFLQ